MARSQPTSASAQGRSWFARQIQRLLLLLIRGYQLTLSLWIGRQCRFYPTCSHYVMESIRVHGPWRGSLLGAKRVSRCHPFHPGGIDLVPAAAATGTEPEDFSQRLPSS